MKRSEEKRGKSKPAMESDSDKSKKSPKKAKVKAPAKPRVKPSFYYVSSSEDEAGMLKDRFWKDLEDGKVDIFRTADLYSTVKAIGRTARPKSLAESDLQKSGIKSMNDEGTSKDTKQRGRRTRKSAEKESKKGNAAAANKADRGKTKTRVTRSLSNSRLRVNLGAKVDASDDEEDLADSDADADIISVARLRNRKKQAKAVEKREEVDKESDGDDTEDDDDDDDEEDEEEMDESESDDEVKAKGKVGKKVVSKRLKTKSRGKGEGGLQSTDKKAGNYGKLQKKGKRDDKDGDDNEDEDGQDKDFSEEDEDLVNKEAVKIKIAKADLQEKIKDNSEKNEDDDDDESDDDSKCETQKDSKAKGEKIKQDKDKAEEVEGEAEQAEDAESDKRVKEPSAKIIVDSEVVRLLHIEDAIDSVISQSAEYWKIHHEDKDKKVEDDMTKVEGDDLQRRGNKRKLEDSNIPKEKSHPKLKKFASGPIDYESTGSDDSETKMAGEKEKLVSNEIDFDRTNTTKGNSNYLGTEQKFKSSVEDDDEEEEEEEEEEENRNEESPVADEVVESVVDKSDQNGPKAGNDISTRKTDSADETEGKDTSPVVEGTEEEDNLDHLVFDLKTVDAVEPEEMADAYSEWNIKALTNEDLSKAVKFNDFDLVQAMMRESQQFDLDQPDASGSTLTMIATQNYFMEIVELLVLNGADVNAKTKDGHTALTLACEKGLHCAVSVLLCLGANVNSPLSNGDTPLTLAVKKNHFHVVRILLEHGVNIGAASSSDRHCLALARQLNYQPIVEILTTHKTQLSGELFQQISMALEGSAKIGAPVFPVQCFRLCDGSRFIVEFRHELQPTQTNRGMLLFVGHGCGSASNVNVKLYGACAVTKAALNNTALQPLNEDNFILTFCPLRDGHNELEIVTVPLTRTNYKVHLIVGAFLVTLL